MSDHGQKSKPTSYDELFPGRFLKAGLLKDKHHTLQISAVDRESFPQGKDKRDKVQGVLSFTKTEMQLALNSTNGQCLKGMFGKKVQSWVGKRITIKPDKTKMMGETVDCIRLHGSPDIEKDMKVTISLAMKSDYTVTMVKTSA